MSTEMLDKLLSMVSDLSDRFTKQEVGVEFALDYLQEGKKANEGLAKDVTSLASKIDKIADDLSVLNTRLDEILSVDPSEDVEEPVEEPAAESLAVPQSTNTATPTTQNEPTTVLDPRLAALTV
jgi:archaellum component FlaC